MTERPKWDVPTQPEQLPFDDTPPRADYVDAYVQHLQAPPLPPPPVVAPYASRELVTVPQAARPVSLPPPRGGYPRNIQRTETPTRRRTVAVVIVLLALAVLIGAMVTWQVTATR